MMDDNIANNIILSSGISLKEAFDNEAPFGVKVEE